MAHPWSAPAPWATGSLDLALTWSPGEPLLVQARVEAGPWPEPLWPGALGSGSWLQMRLAKSGPDATTCRVCKNAVPWPPVGWSVAGGIERMMQVEEAAGAAGSAREEAGLLRP